MPDSLLKSRLRIGLLGVAGITSKTALAISHPETGCQVCAVSSRTLQKAERFIQQFLASQDSKVEALEGYEAMVKSNLVDALYIPLPVAVKKAWVIKALKAGKHVVIEKPTALSSSDYQEMLNAAYDNQKFLLDGTMFPHHQRMHQILDSIGSIGLIHRIEANFTFLADEEFEQQNIRAKRGGDPQGCIGDLGWYCIRYGLMVYGRLGYNVRNAQVVDYKVTSEGVPLDATCVVRFDEGRVLWFHCGFQTAFRQRFEICGSQKSLIVDDLVLPTGNPSYLLQSSRLTNHDLLTVHDRENFQLEKPGPVHEVLLWKTFGTIARQLDSHTANTDSAVTGWFGDTSANKWAAVSMTNQCVLDALIQSIANGGKPVDL